MGPPPVDLLLLNATNLPWRPIFPYAFVQVSAVARRHGRSVAVLDLLDLPRERWAGHLRRELDQHRPRMIGLHIRQGDSVFLDDYYQPPGGPPPRNYFPIEDNRALVALLRTLTDAPLVAGGFGFTTHAAALYRHLGLDYGLAGDPDDLLARFDDVVAGRDLDRVAGLLHAGGANPRGYYPPFEDREYTDAMVGELVRFYGHAQLFGPNPPTVAVEILRGCVFRCYFCTEPHVKGAGLRYRDLDVIEGELDGLMARQLRRFWLICSELDMQGTRFAMALAERIVKLRERHGGLPVEWSAYALPRLEEDELRLLQRAGYAGALNDVLSLDDANLRAAGVPYRSKQAVAFLKAVTRLDREEAAQSAALAAGAEDKIRAGLTQRTPKELASIIGLFLGNAHATIDTLPITLRRIADEGLRDSYRAGLAFPATRVFAPDGEPICATSERGLRTYGRDGRELPIDLLAPTYQYPDFLIERLGSPDAVIGFLRHVADTFLSNGHRGRKDWAHFLTHHVAIETLAALAGTEVAALRRLYAPAPADKAAASADAARLLDEVLAAHGADRARVRGALGLPLDRDLDEYELAERLYARFETRAAVVDAVAPATDGERLYLDWLLFTRNVVLRPGWDALLFRR